MDYMGFSLSIVVLRKDIQVNAYLLKPIWSPLYVLCRVINVLKLFGPI